MSESTGLVNTWSVKATGNVRKSIQLCLLFCQNISSL